MDLRRAVAVDSSVITSKLFTTQSGNRKSRSLFISFLLCSFHDNTSILHSKCKCMWMKLVLKNAWDCFFLLSPRWNRQFFFSLSFLAVRYFPVLFFWVRCLLQSMFYSEFSILVSHAILGKALSLSSKSNWDQQNPQPQLLNQFTLWFPDPASLFLTLLQVHMRI